MRQHTLIRLALTNITKVLHEVANFIYLAGGTTALRRGTMERLYRDVHAGTQHVTSSPNVWQTCGARAARRGRGQALAVPRPRRPSLIAGETARPAQGVIERAGESDALPGDVERRAVVDGRADDRQAERHVDTAVEGQQLHRRCP